MRDFINFIKANFKAFMGKPRTRADLQLLLEDGCPRYAIEVLGVQLTEEELAHLIDLVSKNRGAVDLMKNVVGDKFSLKTSVKKLFAQKAYAYAFKYYYLHVIEMEYHDNAFCKDFNHALVTLEDRKKLLGELWFRAKKGL